MALLRRRERGRHESRISPLAAGIIAAVVIAFLSFFGFTKFNPFSHPFQLKAVFRNAVSLQPKAPVRIAGVNVGIVQSVTPLPGGAGATVTMSVDKDGLPIHSDAELTLRERIFLEGNLFVDVQPGSPSAPIVKSGQTIPVNQTATPVQFGQVLTALQADTRHDLQTALQEYAVKGLGNGGAQAYNQTLKDEPEALRTASIANQATLGTEPHDLSNLERGQQRLFGALSENPQTLQDLLVQLNTTANAFAVQDAALEQTVPDLNATLRAGTPALVALNNAIPSIRVFARVALPGTISSLPTLKAALPLITQLRLLVSPSELEGLVHDLRPTIPALARLNAATIPLLQESRQLSACQNNDLLPFIKAPIPDPDSGSVYPAGNSGWPVYVQQARSLVGLAGESRVNDGLSPMFHTNPNIGATTIIENDLQSGQRVFSQTLAPPQGVRPALPNQKPVFRPNIPCELQVPPNLNAAGGAQYAPQSFTVPGTGLLPPLPQNKKVYQEGILQGHEMSDYLKRTYAGEPAVDPWNITHQQYVQQMKKLGLGVNAQGYSYKLPTGGGE